MNFIKDLAIETGRLTLEGFGRAGQLPKDGGGEYDIATEYDLRAEELVKGRILEEFGEPVLGEEQGLNGDREMARHRLWIVDPVDGTFNFQRGLPMYGVSLAYCEEGVPVCGAIYLPVLDHLFYATRGLGAFQVQDGAAAEPIRVGQETDLNKLFIGVAGPDIYRLLAAFAQVGIPRRCLRCTMCAVFDLAYIASGLMDVYLHTSLNLWDCAAADIILKEAGAPTPSDHLGAPIFPKYVYRYLDGVSSYGFPYLALSRSELYKAPVKSVLSAASLL